VTPGCIVSQPCRKCRQAALGGLRHHPHRPYFVKRLTGTLPSRRAVPEGDPPSRVLTFPADLSSMGIVVKRSIGRINYRISAAGEYLTAGRYREKPPKWTARGITAVHFFSWQLLKKILCRITRISAKGHVEKSLIVVVPGLGQRRGRGVLRP
jgi:hypothetical protein